MLCTVLNSSDLDFDVEMKATNELSSEKLITRERMNYILYAAHILISIGVMVFIIKRKPDSIGKKIQKKSKKIIDTMKHAVDNTKDVIKDKKEDISNKLDAVMTKKITPKDDISNTDGLKVIPVDNIVAVVQEKKSTTLWGKVKNRLNLFSKGKNSSKTTTVDSIEEDTSPSGKKIKKTEIVIENH